MQMWQFSLLFHLVGSWLIDSWEGLFNFHHTLYTMYIPCQSPSLLLWRCSFTLHLLWLNIAERACPSSFVATWFVLVIWWGILLCISSVTLELDPSLCYCGDNKYHHYLSTTPVVICTAKLKIAQQTRWHTGLACPQCKRQQASSIFQKTHSWELFISTFLKTYMKNIPQHCCEYPVPIPDFSAVISPSCPT